MSNKKEELEKLLKEWHKEISDNDVIEGSLFNYDGFVCDNPEDFDGTLIIAKDSQMDDQRQAAQNGIYTISEEPYFWTKKAILEGKDTSKPHLLYKYAILHTCAEYCIKNKAIQVPVGKYGEIEATKNNFKSILKNIAFMNLKKTGGLIQDSEEDAKVVEWAKEKNNKDNIIKEIGIISPKKVIICGINPFFYENVAEIVKKAEEKYHFKTDIFISYHASYVQSYVFFIENFRRIERS